jgi:hypothetical protein
MICYQQQRKSKELGSIKKNLPTSPTLTHTSLSLYKFNKRPSAMIWLVTPDHTPALEGYWDYDPLRKRSQCIVILGLFYNTHLFESRGPREKKEKNKK